MTPEQISEMHDLTKKSPAYRLYGKEAWLSTIDWLIHDGFSRSQIKCILDEHMLKTKQFARADNIGNLSFVGTEIIQYKNKYSMALDPQKVQNTEDFFKAWDLSNQLSKKLKPHKEPNITKMKI